MSATKTAFRTKPLRVAVDGTTVVINSSNELSVPGGSGGGGTSALILKGSDYTIQFEDAGNQFMGSVTFTLPPAVALPSGNVPFKVGFLVPSSGTLTVVCGSGDFIQNTIYSISSSGSIFSSDFGTSFWLVNIGYRQWVVVEQSGSPVESVI